MNAHRSLLGALASLALLTGCMAGRASDDPAATQLVRPYPAGCEDFDFSARRCEAIVTIARRELDIDDPAASVELLSEPPPDCGRSTNGQVILCTRSGGHTAVIVRITPPGGRAEESVFFCGVGSQASIACHADPEITVRSQIEGYHDIACAGEDANGNPTECATPLPTLEPAARAAARPLTIAALDIPIDHDGFYAVELGRVGIANGVLHAAEAHLATTTLPDVILRDGIRLAVQPVDPAGKPFLNIYEHGWRPGVEDARVLLQFDVVLHSPGAVVPIRDVVVR